MSGARKSLIYMLSFRSVAHLIFFLHFVFERILYYISKFKISICYYPSLIKFYVILIGIPCL